jgi:hypothetical protein
LTNCTGYPSSAISGTISLTTQVTGTLPVLNGGTGVTTSTGSGNVVLSTSPTFVTPLLGTPTSGTLTNCTGYTTANLSGTISNAQLANSTISGVSLGGSLSNLTAGTNITFSSGTTYNGSAAITINAASSSQVYPGAGIANSTGSAWGTSYTTSGSGTVVALNNTPTLTNPTVTNYVETLQAVGTVGSTSTLALTNGTVLTATLTASTPCAFTLPAQSAGKSFILKLTQAATGMTTATFVAPTGAIKWPGGTAPTITATASAVDILSFVSDGTNWYGTFAQAFA